MKRIDKEKSHNAEQLAAETIFLLPQNPPLFLFFSIITKNISRLFGTVSETVIFFLFFVLPCLFGVLHLFCLLFFTFILQIILSPLFGPTPSFQTPIFYMFPVNFQRAEVSYPHTL